MRSIGNTTLSLGLLNAPVKLYTATSESDVSFNMCGPKGEPVEQVYRIKGTDKVVGTAAACGRSFDGKQIDTDDIEKINEESLIEEVEGVPVNLKDSMQIRRFIPVKDIPYERVTGRYYIGPNAKAGSDQALATIIKAMEKKKLAAVTKYCLRGRQGIFILYVKDGVLNAVRLSFSASVRTPDEDVEVQSEPVKAHVDAAITLIEEYADKDASVIDEMEDTLVAKKVALIDKVLAGKTVEVQDAEPTEAAPNIMDAIEAEAERVKAKKEKVPA